MINPLECKSIKYSLAAISVIGLFFCAIIMLPQIEGIFLRLIETKILHRSLNNPEKYIDYFFGNGYGASVLFVLMFYIILKRKIVVSSCLLFAALGVYLVLYQLCSGSHEAYRLRFPFVVLLAVIIFHIKRNRYLFLPVISPVKKLRERIAQIKNIHSCCFIFLCGCLLGAFFFLYIFGTAILDFGYTDWLMAGGDLSQQYLGWCMFRNSPWCFPFGLMDNIVYPFRESIIYTDSIPFFALVFKLVSPILPENFQYFGLFGILVYILQGGLGALIIRKTGGNAIQSITGSVFFIISTTMMRRIYEHTSLAAHFVILLCIFVCLDKRQRSVKRNILVWTGIMCLSVCIHIYLMSMAFIFMFFKLLRDYMISKNIKRPFITAGIPFALVVLSLVCLGAFYSRADPLASFLGESSLNLNAFINPMGMSRFIKDMPLINFFQQEGYAYIGLGIILSVIIVITLVLYHHDSYSLKDIFNKTKNTPYALGITFYFLIFSLSPVITLNQYRLFSYPVIPPVEYIWTIFRSTGRYSWPIIYIMITFCINFVIKKFPVAKANGLLMVLLLVQFADLSPYFITKGNSFKSKTVWQSDLASPAWESLAGDYQHLCFLGDYVNLYSFMDLAVKHNMTLNDAYLARKNYNMINKNKQSEIEHIMREGPRGDTIYIFPDFERASLLKNAALCFYTIDGIIIGVDAEKKYLAGYTSEF